VNLDSASQAFPLLDGDRAVPGSASYKTGVLPIQRIRNLVTSGYVTADARVEEDQYQPASLDLRLGPTAYQVSASFLPSRGQKVADYVSSLTVDELDLTSPCMFQSNRVYLVPLMERINFPALDRDQGSPLWAKANPKSTTGRLDVFVRLLVDGSEEFERVPPGYKGPLYAEVSPRSFSIIVREGTRLNQLRFVIGRPRPADTQLTALHEADSLVYGVDDEPIDAVIAGGLWLSVDLKKGNGGGVVGYRASTNAPPVDLARVDAYDATKFWRPIAAPPSGDIILEPAAFYILGSKERLNVPPHFAAEMVNYDPSMGEFRVHYAGFFDPGFGYGLPGRGTQAVLEVRPHEVPFLLKDGQRVGRLLYERLIAPPASTYGTVLGSSYQGQQLRLAKQFRPWPGDSAAQ